MQDQRLKVQNQRFPTAMMILACTMVWIMTFFIAKNQKLGYVYLVEIQQSIFHFELTSRFSARSTRSRRKNIHQTKKGMQEMN